MYKATIQLAKINSSFLLSFNLILEGDPVTEEQNRQTGRSGMSDRPVSKFNSHGYTMFKMVPHPFLTIDISNKMDTRQNGYDKSKRVSLNSRAVYLMQRALHKILADYEKHRAEWYVLDNNRNMTTPGYEQDKYAVAIPLSNGSIIKILPSPVPIDQNDNLGEGFLFCINRMDNYCNMTAEDLGYLSYTIDHLNMQQMAVQLINSEHIFSGDDPLVEHVIHNVAYGVEDEPIHEPPMINRRPEQIIPSI